MTKNNNEVEDNSIHRNNVKRQHRSVALFLVMQCWLRGLDTIRISKDDLKKLIGLDKQFSSRKKWIKEDFEEFFLYNDERIFTVDGEFGKRVDKEYFIFSRVNIEKTFGRKVGQIFEYKYIINEVEIGEIFDTNLNTQESYVSCYLSLLSQGQISPKSMSIYNKEVEFNIDKDIDIWESYQDFVQECFYKKDDSFNFYSDCKREVSDGSYEIVKHYPNMSNENLRELDFLFKEIIKYGISNNRFRLLGITQERYFFFTNGARARVYKSDDGRFVSSLIDLTDIRNDLECKPFSSLDESVKKNYSSNFNIDRKFAWVEGIFFWDLPKSYRLQVIKEKMKDVDSFVNYMTDNEHKFNEWLKN